VGGLKSYLDKDRLNSAFLVLGLPLPPNNISKAKKTTGTLLHDFVATSEVEALLKQASPYC